MMQAPEILMTERLVLRRPTLSDAADIYAYAHDPEVTRYMVWPTHADMSESTAFLETCEPRWDARSASKNYFEFFCILTFAP